MNAERYKAQLALPEIGPLQQEKLQDSRIVMVGAGGLGAASLPYLAGAGIGHITVIDHDTVSRDNLHRQTIYRDDQIGRSKAECTAQYLRALNPDIEVKAIAKKLTEQNAEELCRGFNLLLDGSDNFETKTLLNKISILTRTPLAFASLERFSALVALFDGHRAGAPCYACLFPETPFGACNCSEAGLLGTAAGLAGLYQAHMALCYLLGLDNVAPGCAISCDFSNFRLQKIAIAKNPGCAICGDEEKFQEKEKPMKPIEIISPDEVYASGCIIVDVRTDEEVAADPIHGALHIVLDSLPSRYRELPEDRNLAFACASNVRSMKAAQFMRTRGYENVCVLDRVS